MVMASHIMPTTTSMCIKKEGRINMKELSVDSRCCVGHNRYSTSGYTIENGEIVEEELQPLKGSVKSQVYYLVHNGNIPSARGHDTSCLVDFNRFTQRHGYRANTNLYC